MRSSGGQRAQCNDALVTQRLLTQGSKLDIALPDRGPHVHGKPGRHAGRNYKGESHSSQAQAGSQVGSGTSSRGGKSRIVITSPASNHQRKLISRLRVAEVSVLMIVIILAGISQSR